MNEDIDPGSVLRFSPHEERKPYHKYQHFYAWFLYGMMTILWITVKDFKQAMRYKKLGLTQTESASYTRIFSTILIIKILYYAIFLALPLIFSPISWYFILLGFLLMHFLTGVILGLIFQSAHVVSSSDFPLPDETGNIKADWAVSQLINTSNFAPDSKFLSWFVGDLTSKLSTIYFQMFATFTIKRFLKLFVKKLKNLTYHIIVKNHLLLQLKVMQ